MHYCVFTDFLLTAALKDHKVHVVSHMVFTHTWFESVFQVGHQVVLLEDQRPVQVGDGQIGQRAQTLDHKLLGLLLADLNRQVANVVLPSDRGA